ncbi:MAG: hypothetical protein FWG38_08815, partial [Defluviitaleaceae bacterium]|nr:hypothetical protein [Defluviitaleaceae bacterium]
HRTAPKAAHRSAPKAAHHATPARSHATRTAKPAPPLTISPNRTNTNRASQHNTNAQLRARLTTPHSVAPEFGLGQNSILTRSTGLRPMTANKTNRQNHQTTARRQGQLTRHSQHQGHQRPTHTRGRAHGATANHRGYNHKHTAPQLTQTVAAIQNDTAFFRKKVDEPTSPAPQRPAPQGMPTPAPSNFPKSYDDRDLDDYGHEDSSYTRSVNHTRGTNRSTTAPVHMAPQPAPRRAPQPKATPKANHRVPARTTTQRVVK